MGITGMVVTVAAVYASDYVDDEACVGPLVRKCVQGYWGSGADAHASTAPRTIPRRFIAFVLTPTHPRPRRPRRYWLIPTLIAPSAVFGVWYAYSVIMDRLPELVGLFNSFGGLAAALEGIAVYTDRTSNRSMYSGAGLSDTEQKIQLVVLFLRCSSPTLSTCLCVACCLPVVVAGTNRLIVVAGCAPSQHHRRYDDFHGLHRRCTKADCRVET